MAGGVFSDLQFDSCYWPLRIYFSMDISSISVF